MVKTLISEGISMILKDLVLPAVLNPSRSWTDEAARQYAVAEAARKADVIGVQ
jgi:hypothetical protein